MITDLLLILGFSVLDNLRNQVEQHVFKELPGEDHLRPVMALLQNIQYIAYGWKVSSAFCDVTRRAKQGALPLKSILPSKNASALLPGNRYVIASGGYFERGAFDGLARGALAG